MSNIVIRFTGFPATFHLATHARLYIYNFYSLLTAGLFRAINNFTGRTLSLVTFPTSF